MTTDGYVELHAKSYFTFGVGASHVHELLAQAKEHGYPALALTDTNLCGALEFARLANSLGIRPITGGELTLSDGSRLMLLAETRAGYSNISRLFTHRQRRRPPGAEARSYTPAAPLGRCRPADGRARRAALPADGRWPCRGSARASETVRGMVRMPGSVYVELQQNLTARGHGPQQKADRHRQRRGRPRGRHQRRPLPRGGTVQAPTCADGSKAQHHHRPGAPASEDPTITCT